MNRGKPGHRRSWPVALFSKQRRKAIDERLRRAALNIFCGKFSERNQRRVKGNGWRMVEGLRKLCLP